MASNQSVKTAFPAVFLCLLIATTPLVTASEDDEAANIKAIMLAQQTAWNAGDLDAFMAAYWKSDELTFSSGGKTIRGWQPTLDRYLKRYPNTSAMGNLRFSDLEVSFLGEDAAFVLGKWQLRREQPIGGNFTLIWRRIGHQWRIVHDHSSAIASN